MKATKTEKKRDNMPEIVFLLTIVFLLAFLPANTQAAARPTLNKNKITMAAGTTKQLKVKNRNGKKVKWKSSNKKVVTVSKSGKVKAKNAGQATVTARVGKKKLKCRVTVKAALSEKSITLEEGTFTYLKLMGVKQTVTWTSSDSSVASIKTVGKYKARIIILKKGTATITAEAAGKTFHCKVTAKKASLDNYYTDDGFTTYYELRKSKAVVKKVLGDNPQKYSELERCCKLAAWECKYMTYDKKGKATNGQTAAQAFQRKGKGVCAGYADLYYCLLKAAGVESVKAHNTTTRHAWNIVKVNGKWYNCDITNLDKKHGKSQIDLRYFMKSDRAFSYTPTRKKKYTYKTTLLFSGYSLNPPRCKSKKYDKKKNLVKIN